uniref:Tetraspanin n=1 Tax=Eutreptiella gymnastica TaxID=73025 RepID=A0A7S4LA82_9EUGL
MEKSVWIFLMCSILLASMSVAVMTGSAASAVQFNHIGSFWTALFSPLGQAQILVIGCSGICFLFAMFALTGTLGRIPDMLTMAVVFLLFLAATMAFVTIAVVAIVWAPDGTFCTDTLLNVWTSLVDSHLPLLCTLQQQLKCSGFSSPPGDPSNFGCCDPVSRPACYPVGLLPPWQIQTCPFCPDAADNSFGVPCLSKVREVLLSKFLYVIPALGALDAFVVVMLTSAVILRYRAPRRRYSVRIPKRETYTQYF